MALLLKNGIRDRNARIIPKSRWILEGTMNIDDRLDSINMEMIAFLRTKLDDPGMANYYRNRVETDSMLNSDDRAVIKYIWQNFPDKTRIQEAAAGAGQLGISLGLIGYGHVLAVESGLARHRISSCMEMKLDSACCSFCYPWQVSVIKYRPVDLLVTINAFSSSCDMYKDRPVFQELLDNGTDVIFCPELYGKQGPKEHGLECDTITNITDRIFYFHKKFQRAI